MTSQVISCASTAVNGFRRAQIRNLKRKLGTPISALLEGTWRRHGMWRGRWQLPELVGRRAAGGPRSCSWNAAFVLERPPPAHYNESSLPHSGGIVRSPVRDIRGQKKHRLYLLELEACVRCHMDLVETSSLPHRSPVPSPVQ